MSSAADYAAYLQAFRQGLRDLGYEEAKSISIEYRWAEGRNDRLPVLAAELARLKPDVLVTHTLPGTRAAQKATSNGVASQLIDLAAKRLELLREAVPTLRQVAVLSNLANPTAREAVKETEAAARRLGVRMRSFKVVTEPTELETELTAILRERPDALIVIPDPVVPAHLARILEFAARNRLPTMGGERGFAAAGGLISYGGDFLSYGGDFLEGWRLAARYVDRILKGAKPAELPVEQPTKFDLAASCGSSSRRSPASSGCGISPIGTTSRGQSWPAPATRR